MKINQGWCYYPLLLSFPVIFLLHNINENFGLTGSSDILYLLIVYLITSACIAVVSKLIVGRYSKAFVFAFILLVINFLFGVYKDIAKAWHFPQVIYSYKYLLPLLFFLLMLTAFYLRKTSKNFSRLSKAIAFFLLINISVETGWYVYNVFSNEETRQDFGDYGHDVISTIKARPAARKPTVFWIVFDEYSNSSTLKKVWGFTNPLDSILRSKGFFVADSARSNYNYTHYSIGSTLDMSYLKEWKNHSILRIKDRARMELSIYDNNTLQLFERNGYTIHNFSIFQFQHHITQGINAYSFRTGNLINYQTLEGRARGEIGWNLRHAFKSDKRMLDSLEVIKSMLQLDTTHKALVARCLDAARKGAGDAKPAFYLFHVMLPHAPFIYNADGSLELKNGYHDSAQHYIPQLQYTNSVASMMADSILLNYKKKELVIIMQGDHAYKFHEDDPNFEQESSKILYAVYCSDGDYSWWPRSLSSVNGFRILFNKYFHAGLKLLPDSSYNLYEH